MSWPILLAYFTPLPKVDKLRGKEDTVHSNAHCKISHTEFRNLVLSVISSSACVIESVVPYSQVPNGRPVYRYGKRLASNTTRENGTDKAPVDRLYKRNPIGKSFEQQYTWNHLRRTAYNTRQGITVKKVFSYFSFLGIVTTQ